MRVPEKSSGLRYGERGCTSASFQGKPGVASGDAGKDRNDTEVESWWNLLSHTPQKLGHSCFTVSHDIDWSKARYMDDSPRYVAGVSGPLAAGIPLA